MGMAGVASGLRARGLSGRKIVASVFLSAGAGAFDPIGIADGPRGNVVARQPPRVRVVGSWVCPCVEVRCRTCQVVSVPKKPRVDVCSGWCLGV